jgi:hypothetical protein
MLSLGSAVAWLVLLPAHAKQAHDFVMPYVRAADAIEHTATDLVVIDQSGLLFAEDLVRNDPFLRNRPKVLDLTLLDEANLAVLCARYSISLFGRRVGFSLASSGWRLRRRRAALVLLDTGWSRRQAAHAPLLDASTQQCNSRSLADLGQGVAQRRAGDAHQAQ